MAEKLAEILANIKSGVGNTVRTCNLLSLWGEVVDVRAGKHTQAIKIRNHTLYVETSSPAWAQELSFFKKEMIDKFNKQAGEEAIRDIRFRAGGG